ncbi:MAG: hypothetical protein UDN36_03000 [Christensenellales bacterium]|nr:hypothetical protein [Christensenellales bacterium]
MKRKSIIAVLALVLVLALSLSIFSACNKKHKYSSEWKFDEKTHWHECTTKKHTDTTEKLPHEFKEEIVKAADYGVVGEKKFTCKDCGYSYTEDIDALGAKDNEIKLAEGKTLDKTYDGSAVDVSDKFSFNGNGEVTLMFKAQGAEDDAYAATAPKKVGEYTVKVSVRATAEWKSATKTFDFAITPMVISVAWEHPYDNKNVFSGEPAELIPGEEATITVTMSSANVGAEVQSFEITGKDAGNYSLAREDVNVEIIKADINFEISNASAFNELFFVGATNIPDPTTNYVEIGTGYGERTIDWIRHLGDGVWSRTLTKDEVIGTAGEYRVRIKYAEGDNYNFGATQYVSFTVKKESVLTIKNIIGPDGNPIAGIADSTLGIKFGEDRINMQAQIDGLCEYLTNTDNAEKYFIIRVQCGETVIARFERRGVQTTSDLHYVYTYGGMSFDNDRVTGMHFDLFGANEYVNAEGKWIGNEDLEITIEITDSKDHPVLSKDSLQNSSSVGGGQIAVFEVQLPEGDDVICTFDVSWSGAPKNIEMVLYDAVTGSETSIVVNKVGENKFTFTETSGRKSFYLYVEELEATNNASGFTITASFETSTTRLNFTGNVASDERFYSKGTSVKFIVGVGDASSEQNLKYTVALSNNDNFSYQVHDKQGNAIELVDGSFTIPAGTNVEDYIITVTCENISGGGPGHGIGVKCKLTVTKEIVAA